MNLLKFMESGKVKPTKEDLEKWDKLSDKDGYVLAYKNIMKGMERVSRVSGVCPSQMEQQIKSDFVKGLCNDISKVGFDTTKVLNYMKENNI